MKMFFETFNFNKRYVLHTSNKYICYLFQNIFISQLIKPLCKKGIITYILQKKDNNFLPLPEWEERSGLLSNIRYVNTDFFQSETFFASKETSKLQIKDEFLLEAKRFLSNIPEYYTKVFVHVRRGDYTFESFMGEQGIALPMNYFNNAINIIKEKVEKPFFIFLSDEPEYIMNHFQEIEPKIISRNSMQVDLAIMTMCKAGIISNSSFSWWGAYLNAEKEIIIAPKYWYGWKQQVEFPSGIQPSFSIVLDPIAPLDHHSDNLCN